MVLTDTVSGAQSRHVWPLNLANTTNQTDNWVGFTAGSSSGSGYWYINTWSYTASAGTRLTTPTFSPASGQYAGTQTVTISYPAGSTCYYTVNGLLPTTTSTLYSGPITVSANEVIKAVAIQTGYTDSLVGLSTYTIGTSNTINFPSGFSAGNLVTAGNAYLSGSAYRVTDTTQNTAGAVWFGAPVNVSSFSTTFDLQWGGSGQGGCFVLQNNQAAYPTQAYTQLTGVQITGTSGQISFTNPSTLRVGQGVMLSGTYGGTGSISGYPNALTTYVVTAAGAGTATLAVLQNNSNPTTLTTTAGTPTGLLWSVLDLSWSLGETPLGGSGQALGYGGLNATNWSSGNSACLGTAYGLLNSIALAFTQYNINGDPANSVGLYTNGDNPFGNGIATGLTFSSGHIFSVTLTYSGTTLAISMTDQTTLANFSHNFTGINIASIVGASTAYAGITGGSGGGAAAVLAITNWTGF